MDNQSLLLNLARFSPNTRSLGPGNRAVVWVQGCHRRCPGCLAPEWLDFRPNLLLSPNQLADRILLESGPISGLTFSGGEPMEQAGALAMLAQLVREQRPELNIICFSGYRYEQLIKSPPNPGVEILLSQIDVLVDGPYIKQLNNGLGLRGSRNQRFLHLTSRLQNGCLDDFPRGVEIQIDGASISMIGIPPLGMEPVLEILNSVSSYYGIIPVPARDGIIPVPARDGIIPVPARDERGL